MYSQVVEVKSAIQRATRKFMHAHNICIMSVNYIQPLFTYTQHGGCVLRGDTDQSDCSQNHDFTVRGIQVE